MSTEATHAQLNHVSDSKNLSQLIRSNAREYWPSMKNPAHLRALQPYLEFVGTVAGDPHLGDFGPIPVTTVAGTREVRFVNIDFDDAGCAPFVLDYVRYLAAIKSQCKPMRSSVLLNNYVLGLKGEKIAPPKEVQKFLEMKISDYDKMAAQYCKKQSLGDGFKFKASKIDRYTGTIKEQAISKLFPGEKVLCVAKRVEERGGSSDEAPIW